MDTEVTNFVNLPAYTNEGQYVGVVQNVILDLPNRRIGSLLLTRTSTRFVEGGQDVAVPFRWVAAAGDILLLSHFPEKVTTTGTAEEEVEETVPA